MKWHRRRPRRSLSTDSPAPAILPMSRISTFLILCLAALPLASCDGTTDDPVVFGGVALDAVGGATLRPVGTTLVVSDLPAGAEGGFAVPGPRQRVDVAIVPVEIPVGGRFGTRVESAAGAEIASMVATGVSAGTTRFEFSYGAVAGVTRVGLRYLFGGQVLFEVPALSVPLGRAAAVVATQSAGEGSGETGSVHAVRSGGRWIVVSDNEGSGNRPARGGDGNAGGCAVLSVVPPTVAGIQPPRAPLCVDRIEVVPLTGTAPEAGRIVVASQGLTSFTVRTLGVE